MTFAPLDAPRDAAPEAQPAPRVSVILPAYNQERYLGEAMASVQAQSFPDWELIVVDDGSTDATAAVAQAASADRRIRLLRQANAGPAAARNAGLAVARGRELTFLDADDTFHPHKLSWLTAHLDAHPELGLSYGGRVEIDAAGLPVTLLRSPAQAALDDLVLGFPFSMNDFLLRRAWYDRLGGFDDAFRLHSEDREFWLRLARAGCQMGGVPQFVAYRRVHPGRRFARIPERLDVMAAALETVFAHPDCPPALRARRDPAHAQDLWSWGLQELIQGETAAGQAHVGQAVALDPDLAAPQRVARAVVWAGARDGGDPAPIVQALWAGLPDGLRPATELARLLGRAALLRASRALLFGRDEAAAWLAQARPPDATVDADLLDVLGDQLAGLEVLAGAAAAEAALERLLTSLGPLPGGARLRQLAGTLAANRAFACYQAGAYAAVPGNVWRALRQHPAYVTNRGLLAILGRALLRRPAALRGG